MTEEKKEKRILVKRKKTPEEEAKLASFKRVHIGVSIDENLWLRLRALALIEKKDTGKIIDEAFKEYLDKHPF
jgi:hypothetical protein